MLNHLHAAPKFANSIEIPGIESLILLICLSSCHSLYSSKFEYYVLVKLFFGLIRTNAVFCGHSVFYAFSLPNKVDVLVSNCSMCAEYRTVSGVAGPLVILEKVKVCIFLQFIANYPAQF